MSQLFLQFPLEWLRLCKLHQRLITQGANDLDEHPVIMLVAATLLEKSNSCAGTICAWMVSPFHKNTSYA